MRLPGSSNPISHLNVFLIVINTFTCCVEIPRLALRRDFNNCPRLAFHVSVYRTYLR